MRAGAETTPRGGTADAPSLETDFDKISARLPGNHGLALLPVGASKPLTALGTWRAGVAWSTVKVPMAVAAVRAENYRPSARTSALLRQAVTASDNNAAERLWTDLGSGRTAAAATESVLRDAGDRTTNVQSVRVRPEFTPFGQSSWSLTDQAVFAGRLPCIKGSRPVLDLMGQVNLDQRWGLGSLNATVRFKGGWGPDASGRYLVRQFGIVSLPKGGQIAVALASQPSDGSFVTGTANLTALARWLQSKLPDLHGGSC